VADSPALMDIGAAEKVTVGGLATMTVAWRVVVPPVPLAVRVYVMLAVGVTVLLPLALTEPMP